MHSRLNLCITSLYCLVYGQMSHWGSQKCASNILIYKTSYKEILNSNYVCTSRYKINNYNGPLNKDILSIIYGSLLGDGHAEKRIGGKGTRICFYQEDTHKEYLYHLHELVSKLGYCNTNKPNISTRIGKNGKIRQILRFSTWTYTSFNKIRDEWYLNNKKIIPKSLKYNFTPLLIAIWIMDDGGKIQNTVKLATNSLILEDIKYLQKLFLDIYQIETSIHNSGVKNQYVLYIKTSSMDKLRKIVSPYIITSMKYKINI